MDLKFLLSLFLSITLISNVLLGQSEKLMTWPEHYYNHKVSDINQIHASINNIGGLDDYTGPLTGAHWLEVPDNYKIIVYDQGLWVLGKINNFPHWSFGKWSQVYSPGPIINGEPAIQINPQDSLRYRVYKISVGDDNSNPDYAEWPNDFGAPVNDVGNPLILGDQTLWTVYNGLDSSLTYRNWWNTNRDTLPVMPIEVQQMSYGRAGNSGDDVDIFSNVMFIEWTIINKGNETIDSTYLGLWTDIDFFGAYSNLPGIDTVNQLGFCWTDIDSSSGLIGPPPAVGYTLLYGPVIPATGQTAIFRGKVLNDYRNMSLASFRAISDDGGFHPVSGFPGLLTEAWNITRGLDLDGNDVIDPMTSLPKAFPFSGDPVTNTGWVYDPNTYGIGGGAGFVMFTGFLTMAPNDTQWVMAALVPGLGNDKLESIEKMRQKTEILHSLPYDSLAFGKTPIFLTEIKDEKTLLPESVKLYQNYPNPFNAATKIEYSLATAGKVELTVYDVLGREVAKLVNQHQKTGKYSVNFDGSLHASGVYLYKLKTNENVKVKKCILLR